MSNSFDEPGQVVQHSSHIADAPLGSAGEPLPEVLLWPRQPDDLEQRVAMLILVAVDLRHRGRIGSQGLARGALRLSDWMHPALGVTSLLA